MKSHDILACLSYFDAFDYPLTLEELYFYLPTKSKKDEIKRAIKKLKLVGKYSNFFYIKDKKYIIKLRKKRERISLGKIKIARKITKELSKIPTVQLVGISGALAMKNCDENDDIDLFLMTRKGTVWSTRIAVLLYLQLVGKRRKAGDTENNNKICLNMIIDENKLTLSQKRQNLYGAHEAIQMIPLFERKNIYNRFVVANNWIFKFLPNSKPRKVLLSRAKNNHLSLIFIFLEPFARIVQKIIMKKITLEEVSNTMLAFHPIDYQSKILSLYKKRLKALI